MPPDPEHPRQRLPPFDRRKLPLNQAMIDVALGHGLSGSMLQAFELAWRYHQFWESGVAWNDQAAFRLELAFWLDEAERKAPEMTARLRMAIVENGSSLARLIDETLALLAYYEG